MIVQAPWSPAQIKSLQEYQTDGGMHGYTCATHSDVLLRPEPDGWVCPVEGCPYAQTWAHDWTLDYRWAGFRPPWLDPIDAPDAP